MDLAPFIRDLILLNECVILRGVGGFETSYKNAILDTNKKVIAPPSKKIHFRVEWIKDNGVLENHIAESLNISREKASDHIDNYVQELFNNLKEKASVSLGDIGEFSLDENHKLQFHEQENANYLADSFGLDILNLGEPDPKPVRKSPAKSLSPIEPQRRKLTGWYITVGVLLLVISITVIIILSEGGGIELFSLKKQTTSDELVVFGNQPLVREDSITQSIAKTLDTSTSPRMALSIEDNTSTRTSNKALPAGESEIINYYLVAGSFKTIRNAEIMKDQLVRKGFQADVITTGVNVRVIVGKYTNRKLALAELRRMRQQLDQSVWLLEEK